MSKNSIITRCFLVLTAMTLCLNLSIPCVASASDIPSDASNSYMSDEVTMQKVSFKNQYNMKVAGNLFIPKGLKQDIKNPAIIVGHPMGAVKEQSANLYATKYDRVVLIPWDKLESFFTK